MKPQRKLYSLPHITTFLLYALTYSASPLILLCIFDINNNNAHILIPIAIYTIIILSIPAIHKTVINNASRAATILALFLLSLNSSTLPLKISISGFSFSLIIFKAVSLLVSADFNFSLYYSISVAMSSL